MEQEKKQEKKVTKADQIAGLIAEYNKLEAEAYDKLEKIFYILKAGKGYRKLVFESEDVLSNCWDADSRRFDQKLHLSRYNRKIKDYEISDPESIEV
jgi:hypothetical protein